MSINITTEEGYVKVEATGIYEEREQSENLDPDQARDMAEKLELLADRAEGIEA